MSGMRRGEDNRVRAGEAMPSPLQADAEAVLPLQAALVRQDFDYAARCLLVGVARALEKMPAGSLEGLLDVITGRNDGPEARRRKPAKKSL